MKVYVKRIYESVCEKKGLKYLLIIIIIYIFSGFMKWGIMFEYFL